MNITSFLSGSDLSRLLDGLTLSVQLTGLGLLFGLPLGLIFAIVVDVRSRIVRTIGLLVVELSRGTPLLVMLYLVYYGLPQTGLTLSRFVAATCTFAITYGAYTGEVFRSSLKAIPPGQWEASASLGLARWQTFRKVILPQSARIALPQLVSFAVLLFQASALAFSISLPELLSQAYQLSSQTFLYLQYLTLAGILYAVVAIPVAQFARWLEFRQGLRL